MDIERGNIEIVFQKIPYMYVIKSQQEMVDYCSYSKMEKDIYMRYSSDVFSYATDDERSNNYSFMCSQMKLQTNLWKNDVSEDAINIIELIKSVCQAEITPCCEIYYGFYTYCRNQSPTSSGIAKKVERMFDKVTTLTISYSEFFEIFAQTKRILVEEKLTFDKYLLEISLMSLKGYSSTDISEIMRENYLK